MAASETEGLSELSRVYAHLYINCINNLYVNLYINLWIYYINSSVYILIYILRSNMLFYCAGRFIFHLYFSSQTDFYLKNVNQKFLLFGKSVNKQSIHCFII